jgi:PAS domain S-box-containing protein
MDVLAGLIETGRQRNLSGAHTVLGEPDGIRNLVAPAQRVSLPRPSTEVLEALQAAVYTTDAEGRITFYNEAAAKLWGVHPEIGKSEFCGSWRMQRPDGTPLAHNECPMATALKEGRAIAGAEAVAIRPDGTKVPFLAYPTPLRDSAGAIVGAVNMLVDISGRKNVERSAQIHAAIVESSQDAIVSKDLNGIIQSWNAGAEHLFGYTSDEAIGKSVMMLIPEGLQDEEPEILARIRRGERIEHYETVRQRRDGSPVQISLTVSPIKDDQGRIIGASKIARDNTEKKRIEEEQRLLLREMNHRVKNLFSLTGSIVEISARHAKDPKEMARAVRARLAALARAHDLTLPTKKPAGTDVAGGATNLRDLLQTAVEPYLDAASKQRVEFSGPKVPVSGRAVTGLALLLHEFTTNAAKYGALSVVDGRLTVEWWVADGNVLLTWRERGGPPVSGKPESEGFGSLLTNATAVQFGGKISREWRSEGLVVTLSIPQDRLAT